MRGVVVVTAWTYLWCGVGVETKGQQLAKLTLRWRGASVSRELSDGGMGSRGECCEQGVVVPVCMRGLGTKDMQYGIVQSRIKLNEKNHKQNKQSEN